MADTNTYQAQANELSQKLWAIANELRGTMDASEFKNYIYKPSGGIFVSLSFPQGKNMVY